MCKLVAIDACCGMKASQMLKAREKASVFIQFALFLYIMEKYYVYTNSKISREVICYKPYLQGFQITVQYNFHKQLPSLTDNLHNQLPSLTLPLKLENLS